MTGVAFVLVIWGAAAVCEGAVLFDPIEEPHLSGCPPMGAKRTSWAANTLVS
jgi:hypothetical protein